MLRIIAVLASVTLVAALTGCVGGQAAPQPSSVPDATTPSSHFLAAPAPRPGGSIAEAAATLAKQATETGAPSQSALRRALMMAGINLADGDTVVDQGESPTAGIQLPEGQLLYVAGQNNYSHSETAKEISQEIKLMDFRDTSITEATIQQKLLDGLRALEPPEFGEADLPVTAQFYGAFFADLGRDASPSWDIDSSGIEDVRFTGMQVWLVWAGVASGFMRTAAFLKAGQPGPTVDAAEYLGSAASGVHVEAGSPCSVSDGQGKGLDLAAIGAGAIIGGIPFTELGGLVGAVFPESANPAKTMGVGDALGWANAALALLHIAADSFSFDAKVTIAKDPLVRTKNLGDPGEQTVMTATAKFDLGKGAYANCVRLALNASGADFTVPNNGPIKNSSVQWTMYDDPAGADNNPTEFYLLDRSETGDSVQSNTNDKGEATMGLEGLGQRYILPPDPPSYMRKVSIRIEVELKSNDFYNDLVDGVSASAAGFGMPAAILSALIEHAHAFGTNATFNVKDWVKDFKISNHVDLSSGGSGPEYPFVSGLKCGGLAGPWSLNDGGVTFTLDKDGQGTAAGGYGPVHVTYLPGDPAKLKFTGEYFEQTVPVIPGNFCKH